MAWRLRLSHRAAKSLRRMGSKDRRLVSRALDQIAENPFRGDVRHIAGQPSALRRRVGAWRIFLHVDVAATFVDVTAIERRTSITYRKRS